MAKVLIVEDNEMNRDMLRRRLERRGYEVECAIDGPAASTPPCLYARCHPDGCRAWARWMAGKPREFSNQRLR